MPRRIYAHIERGRCLCARPSLITSSRREKSALFAVHSFIFYWLTEHIRQTRGDGRTRRYIWCSSRWIFQHVSARYPFAEEGKGGRARSAVWMRFVFLICISSRECALAALWQEHAGGKKFLHWKQTSNVGNCSAVFFFHEDKGFSFSFAWSSFVFFQIFTGHFTFKIIACAPLPSFESYTICLTNKWWWE